MMKGLVGCWLPGDRQTGKQPDLSGHRNDGIINTGGGPLQRIPFNRGGVNAFFRIDGPHNQYLDCGTNPDLNGTGGLSVLSVVSYTGAGAFPVIISKSTSNDGWYIEAFGISGNLEVGVIKAGSFTSLAPVSLPRDRWTTVAMTYDNVTLRAYMDGVQTGFIGASGALGTSTAHLGIGALLRGSVSNNFPGGIGPTFVWNRTIGPAEMKRRHKELWAGIWDASPYNLGFGKGTPSPTSTLRTYADVW